MKIKSSALRIVGITTLLTAAYLPSPLGATTGPSDAVGSNPLTLNSRSIDRVTALRTVVGAQAVATNPPVAIDDAYTITDGNPLTVSAPGVLGNDTNAVRVMPVTGPTSGALTLKPNGSFTYDPLGTTGTVTFSYKALNGSLTSPTAAAVTITITSGGGGGTGTPSTTPPPSGPDGAALYASSCAACHGAGGLNTTLSNTGVVTKMTTGSMNIYAGGLSTADIQAIADFIVAPGSGGGKGGGSGTPPTTPPPTETTSQGLYQSFCAACHSADGRGTALGPDIVGESRAEIFEVVRWGDDSMPAFSIRVLSDGDLGKVADFLASLGGDDEGHEDDDHDGHEDDDHEDDDHDGHEDDDHDGHEDDDHDGHEDDDHDGHEDDDHDGHEDDDHDGHEDDD